MRGKGKVSGLVSAEISASYELEERGGEGGMDCSGV